MSHDTILIKNLCLSFGMKNCFEGFTSKIHFGDRIAIIGKNGSGKSSLLKILQGQLEPSAGEIYVPDNVVLSYIPQIIEEFTELSGGESLNKYISKALAEGPNILLLDEPTNHLDPKNRESLMRMLNNFYGTIIFVSHDEELLYNCINTLWHIHQEQITSFSGKYCDYIRENDIKRTNISQQLRTIKHEKKKAHEALMKEQERAKKSKNKGKKNFDGDKLLAHHRKQQAQTSNARNKGIIDEKKQQVSEKLSELWEPENISVKFYITSSQLNDKNIITISRGKCGFSKYILTDINLTIGPREKVALIGNNGSGKTTFIRAILKCSEINIEGNWHTPPLEAIGYLDQLYSNLDNNKTVLQNMEEVIPSWTHVEHRKHLNDFLFRKNNEVETLVCSLSGGEKARLSLAQISAKTPKLLILDEVTNNIDLETKEHIIQVLNEYPGAMIIISHDRAFLKKIRLDSFLEIKDGFIYHQLQPD